MSTYHGVIRSVSGLIRTYHPFFILDMLHCMQSGHDTKRYQNNAKAHDHSFPHRLIEALAETQKRYREDIVCIDSTHHGRMQTLQAAI
jgi:phosphoenolpyruvate synthase/pyruvate phosphate dikinase